jgi:PAS domain S-box-containing protein
MWSGRSNASGPQPPEPATGTVHRLIDPRPRARTEAPAFEAEGLARCVDGARIFGLLAITLLLASAAVSFAIRDEYAVQLLAIRLLGITAIGAALWHLRGNRRHPRLAALAIILMIGATIEALAAYTGGASSIQHDRLNLVILGVSVLITWPTRWVALTAGGIVAEFLLNAAATDALGSPPFMSDIGSLLMCSAATIIIGAIRERQRLRAFDARVAREVAARQLAEQEARYRSLVETVGSAIIVIALDYRILEFNTEAERISGYRREDVIGRDYVGLFVPEDVRPVLDDVVRALLAGERDVVAEGAFRCADGSERILHWHNVCLRDADGRLVALLGSAQDVTERRRAERALQESEARLRRLVETTKAIPWEADAATCRFTYVGPQAVALGYPLEAWTEPDFWPTHIHPEDRERAVAICHSSSQRLSEYDFEYRMLAADGRVVWLHDLVSVERRDGAPWLLRGFLIDITEQKAAEHEVRRLNEGLEARVLARTAELRESEARLRSILEASPLGGAIVSDDDRFVGTNPALRALLGLAAGDGFALTAVVHPDDRAAIEAALEDLRGRHADVRTVDMRYVRRDGAAVWAQTSLVATGADHGPQQIFAMIEDVTARRRKQAVAEGERVGLRVLARGGGLEAALGALLECLERNDPEAVCSVLLADEQGRLRHGAAPRLDERLRHAFDGIEVGPLTASACGTASAHGSAVVIEDVDADAAWEPVRALTAAHGLRACWWQPVHSAAGQLLGTFAMYHHTPRRPTEDEHMLLESAAGAVAVVIERQRGDDLLDRHRNELAHVGRVSLLAELAGGLAHEMQQPLASIVNYAGGCERLLRGGTVELEQILDGMERIQNTALRAGQIIRGIRALAERRAASRERVDVNDVARAAAQLVEGRARQHGVTIRMDLGAGVPCVLADRIQLEQVLLNLLSNALEAMSGRTGYVTIHTRLRDDGAVAVAVEDAGQGIREDVASRIFEPFFTTKATGLGLGLSIGRTIVESHEGRMWAAPAIGGNGGAVVGFSLPAAAPPENGTRVVRSERPAADDDASRRVVNGHRRTRAAR